MCKPVQGIRQLPPFFNDFHPIVADKVISISGYLYPIIFFDISDPCSDWRLKVKLWEGIRVDRILVKSVGFDHANIHVFGNFVQMVSKLVLFKHCDKQHIFQAYDRTYALPLKIFTDDEDVKMPGNIPGKSAGKTTSKSTSKSTGNAKAKATPTKPPEPRGPIQHTLHHIKYWEEKYYNGRQLTATNGPTQRRRLRTSKEPKSCSTFTHAVYSCATESVKNDTEENIKQICMRESKPSDKKAGTAGFDQ